MEGIRSQEVGHQAVTQRMGETALSAGEAIPSTARIWIGSLADYNGGHLHGEWIDANQEPEELHSEVLRVLASSPIPDAEEWGIFDYEGFGDLKLSEYEQLEVVSKIASGIEEHGPAFVAWAQYLGPQQLDQLDSFQDHYLGEWPSVRAYVESYLDDIGFSYELEQALNELPESLSRYVRLDIEALARDCEKELQVVELAKGGVWVFDLCF